MSDGDAAAFTVQFDMNQTPVTMEPEPEPKPIGRSHVRYLGSSWVMLITE